MFILNQKGATEDEVQGVVNQYATWLVEFTIGTITMGYQDRTHEDVGHLEETPLHYIFDASNHLNSHC